MTDVAEIVAVVKARLDNGTMTDASAVTLGLGTTDPEDGALRWNDLGLAVARAIAADRFGPGIFETFAEAAQAHRRRLLA